MIGSLTGESIAIAKEWRTFSYVDLNGCKRTIAIPAEKMYIKIKRCGYARLEYTYETVGNDEGIEIQRSTGYVIKGLPDPKPDYYWVVTKDVYDAAKASSRGAADLYFLGNRVPHCPCNGYTGLFVE